MMPTVRSRGSRRHVTAGLLGIALVAGGLTASVWGRTAPPATTVPTANASISVGSPAIAPPAADVVSAPTPATTVGPESAAIDPVADQRREHGRRPLGGVPGIAVGQRESADIADAAGPAAAGSTILPPATDATGGPGELIRVGAALGAVLAIAVVAARFGRRFGGAARAGRPAGVLEIMARYPVGRGQHLLVLRFDRRLLLVHQAGGRMERIAEVAAADEVASLLGRLEAGASGGEADRFRRALADFEHGRGPAELRPDGLFPSEVASRMAGGRVADAGPDRIAGDRAAGLAAAIRAARRRVAYGTASTAAPAATRPPAANASGRTARVELVDLTRGGGRR
jgi:flagellar biogenesis protein FliO